MERGVAWCGVAWRPTAAVPNDDDGGMSSAATPAPPARTERLWQIDALRGLMLVLMTLTHLPTRFSSPAGQPFGFVSAAEGFVLLSGFMAGMVYTSRERRDGAPVMRDAFYKRVFKIYLCQAALLLFLFSFIALIGVVGQQDAIRNLVSFYLTHPLPALFGGLLLVHNPPLLDILPMYILFMLASPILLVHGLRQGWSAILAVSVALWLGAQFGLGQVLYEAAVVATGLPVPFQETGAFQILAWQFLWVMGLWMGSTRAATAEPVPVRFPAWMVRCAIVIGVVGLVWRHGVGQVPFPGRDDLNLMLDKWQLAPLRLINLFALLVLTVHFGPWLSERLPRLRFLETLGAASLPVFCTHLVLALLALALAGEPRAERASAIDVSILIASFAVLYAVALISREFDRHAAAVQQRFKTRLRARASARLHRGGKRSRSSRPDSPPG